MFLCSGLMMASYILKPKPVAKQPSHLACVRIE